MTNKEFELNYLQKNTINDILEFENIINNLYEFDNFIFKLSIENKYNSNDILIRFVLSNDLHKKSSKNGLITLYHKILDFNEYKDILDINDFIVLFFNLQKTLNEKINLSYELKDCRK